MSDTVTQANTLLRVLANGFKDKFITLCGGALLLSCVYVFFKDNVDFYIIRDESSEFTYIATIVLVLSFTYIVNLIQQFLNSTLFPYLNYLKGINKFRVFVNKLTQNELKFVKDSILQEGGDNCPYFEVASTAEIQNLKIFNKVSNLRYNDQTQSWHFSLSGIRYDIGESPVKYEVLEKAIQKHEKK